jgi:hypothetical protein
MRHFASLVILGGCVWLLAGSPCGAGPTDKPAPKKNFHDPLPATNHWDLKVLQALGTILTTRHEKASNRIVWTIEAKKFDKLPRIAPLFYDDEGSFLRLGENLEFVPLPKEKDDRKEKMKVILQLPGKDVLKETFRVVLRRFEV